MGNFKPFFLASDDLPKDDIDKLFEKLVQVDPPPFLTARIMSSLVLPPSLEGTLDHSLPPLLLNELALEEKPELLDGLVVRKDKLPPS